jgi:hypothetical protein
MDARDSKTGRTRFLGRFAVMGAATVATLLAASTISFASTPQTVANAIPCTLTVSTPTYNSGSGTVQSTATIRCAYPTTIYLQVGLSYNGNTPVYNGQSFPSGYSASLTVSRSAAPGYYQANAVSVLGDGEQYGYYYSNNVYIPQ